MYIDISNAPFKIAISKDTIVSLQFLDQSINYYRHCNRGVRPSHLFISIPLFMDVLRDLRYHGSTIVDPKEIIFQGVKICSSYELNEMDLLITKKNR